MICDSFLALSPPHPEDDPDRPPQMVVAVYLLRFTHGFMVAIQRPAAPGALLHGAQVDGRWWPTLAEPAARSYFMTLWAQYCDALARCAVCRQELHPGELYSWPAATEGPVCERCSASRSAPQ